MKLLTTTENTDLLAARANAEHLLAAQTAATALGHALAAGEALAKARAQLPHGQWLPWLEKNCTFSPRTAQTYLRIYDRRDTLPSNAQRVSHLPIRQAAKLLAEPKAPDESWRALIPPPGHELIFKHERGGIVLAAHENSPDYYYPINYLFADPWHDAVFEDSGGRGVTIKDIPLFIKSALAAAGLSDAVLARADFVARPLNKDSFLAMSLDMAATASADAGAAILASSAGAANEYQF